MGALSKAAILARAQKPDTREVHVAAWADEAGNDVVVVRGLTAKEWDAHQAATRIYSGGEEVGVDQGNISAKLLVRCILDSETGERMFADADADAIGNLAINELNPIFEAINELSGITEKAQGEIEGNSDAAPSGETLSG